MYTTFCLLITAVPEAMWSGASVIILRMRDTGPSGTQGSGAAVPINWPVHCRPLLAIVATQAMRRGCSNGRLSTATRGAVIERSERSS